MTLLLPCFDVYYLEMFFRKSLHRFNSIITIEHFRLRNVISNIFRIEMMNFQSCMVVRTEILSIILYLLSNVIKPTYVVWWFWSLKLHAIASAKFS